jgi:hypothetical protein
MRAAIGRQRSLPSRRLGPASVYRRRQPGIIPAALPPAPILRCSLALTPGTRGVYEVTAQIGEGGMGEERHMVTTDPYEEGVQETRQDFTANDFRITRALDSLLISAKSITGDEIAGEDIAARVHTLRHLLKQVGHDV